MTLSHRHRVSIFGTLSPLLGEEETEALLAQFPADEHDRLVTEGVLRAELAALRSEFRDEIGKLRTEMRTEIAAVRTDMASMEGRLRAEMHQLANRTLVVNASVLLAGMGLAAAIG